MKKIFFLTFLLPVIAFVYQSCKPVDNSKEIARADSIADARLIIFRDSLKMVCMSDVMAAAKMRADSMMTAAMSGKKGGGGKKTVPPATSKDNNGKLSDKLNQDGKLKDKLNTSDTTKKKGGKLKDKLNTQPPPK